MAEVTGVKVNELPKKTAYDESDLIYVVGNGVDLKMEMKDLKRNVAPDVFSGATELTPGEKGLVPTPTVTDSNKVLGGDGEWKELAPVATSGEFDDLINKPEITEVEANPTDTPTAELEKITIGTTTYSILSSKVYGEATGDLITIEDAMEAPLEECQVTLEPQQDLNGYEYPWVGGAGRNLFNMGSKINGNFANMTVVSDDNYITFNGTKYGQNVGVFSALTFSLGAGTYYAKAFAISGTAEVLPTISVYKAGGSYATDNILNAEKSFMLDAETTLNIAFTFSIDNKEYSNYKLGVVISKTANIDKFYPYSNICPISGWTECKVQRTGVNIWDEEWESGSYRSADGTPSIDAGRIRSKNKTEVISDDMYLVTLASTLLFFYDANDEYLGYKSKSTSGSITPMTWYPDAKYFHFSVGSSSNPVTDYTSGIAINYPSTDTEYHAYQGTAYTIQLGSTYYGGELDVINGVLKVTEKMIILDGSSNYRSVNSVGTDAGLTFGRITLGNSEYGINNTATNKTILADRLKTATIHSEGGILITSAGTVIHITLSDQTLTTVEQLNAWLQSNNVEVVYRLATPQEIQLTPTEVTLLLGINNLWSDGEMYVKYRRDLDIFLNKLEARVRALEEG